MSRLVCACLVAVACVSAPPVSTDDAAARLRARRALADDDLARSFVDDELRIVELRRAQEANTVFAYKRFLAEFPTGSEATTARALLEGLRFTEAEKAGTAAAWEAFLEEHPRGRKLVEANEQLGTILIAAAQTTTNLPHVRTLLARFPTHPKRAELEAREDVLAFEAAKEKGLDALVSYLDTHPNGARRNEAIALRDRLEREELVSSDDLERAVRRAASDASPEWQRAVDEIRLARALRSLDLETLRTIAGSDAATAPAAKDERRPSVIAASVLAAFDAKPLAAPVLESVRAAAPTAGLRPRDEALKLLTSADPVERVAVLQELAESSRREDAERAIAALDMRWIGVRLAAVEALRSLAKSMPAPVWSTLSRLREQESLANALSADPWRRVAALRDANDRTSDALVAWREVLRHDPDDLAARVRVLALARRLGDRIAVETAARDLAKAAVQFGDERWLAPSSAGQPDVERRDGPGEVVGLPASVTVLRQLCAAVDGARLAGTALEALTTNAAAEERDQLRFAADEVKRSVERMELRRVELEREARRREPKLLACGVVEPAARFASVRKARVDAVTRLGATKDARLVSFVEALAASPSDEVRGAVAKALEELRAQAPTPAPISPAK